MSPCDDCTSCAEHGTWCRTEHFRCPHCDALDSANLEAAIRDALTQPNTDPHTWNGTAA